MMENKIAITGSDGFIGKWLCKYLNIPLSCQFDVLSGNDCTCEKVQNEVVKSKAIILLHAISGIRACEENPVKAMSTNAESVIDIALKAKQSGVKRLILASSSSVYGEIKKYNVSEDHATCPRTIYGASKLAAEKIMEMSDENFEIIILRKSNVYGWGFNWKSTVIDNFITQYINRDSMTVEGSGEQKRDFIDLMDAVRLYGKIATLKKARSGIYNLGGNEVLSIRSIAELVNNIGETIFGHRVNIVSKGNESGSGWHDFKYDSSKAQMEWQFSPAFKVEEHIKARLKDAMRK